MGEGRCGKVEGGKVEVMRRGSVVENNNIKYKSVCFYVVYLCVTI